MQILANQDYKQSAEANVFLSSVQVAFKPAALGHARSKRGTHLLPHSMSQDRFQPDLQLLSGKADNLLVIVELLLPALRLSCSLDVIKLYLLHV